MKRILFISFSVALGLNLCAQNECENPDLNCDGIVNVNDLLGMLSYFGDEEDGQWLEGDDCFSPDVNCDGFVNVNDLLVLRFICFLGGAKVRLSQNGFMKSSIFQKNYPKNLKDFCPMY